ncbi:Cas9 inhibitor AcrIIA9 family protein [Clostridium saudiense]|uniref:Cas9 inhibitor AcrIIA9 family protein n=1 Tax=Clostridium saudiense TaxID=1414720 RepID=UPI002913B5A5|nr:Cas9 inhibitor AcrIIA9 family protein [Clostridium saudiense]MDU7453131.1 Cas9 inhibitor AcrIIA9 family protein [Clostridium saudiense]
MIERAIEKIKSEMEQKKDNSYIQAIGDYLLKQVEINRNAAEKICNEKKSIEKSLKEVEKVARKKAVAGCAVLSDNEVFKIVREYYQFEAVQDKFIQVEVEEIKEQIQEDVNEERVKEKKEDSKTDDFSINFDDYL